MKKISELFLLASALVFVYSSCRREGVTITKTIEVKLKVNESYSYTVAHAGDADDVMQIIQQASHSSVCTITPDASSGDALFSYTPARDYTGTDQVRVSNVEEHHGGGHHGNCGGGGHHHDDTYNYIFNFTIESTP